MMIVIVTNMMRTVEAVLTIVAETAFSIGYTNRGIKKTLFNVMHIDRYLLFTCPGDYHFRP